MVDLLGPPRAALDRADPAFGPPPACLPALRGLPALATRCWVASCSLRLPKRSARRSVGFERALCCVCFCECVRRRLAAPTIAEAVARTDCVCALCVCCSLLSD